MNVASHTVRKGLKHSKLFAVSNKPKTVKARVKAKHIAGVSNRQIAIQEKIADQTVARIVNEPDVLQFVANLRSQYYGLGELAIAAVKYQLQEKMNGKLGHQILEGTGVVPKENRAQKAAEAQPLTPEQGYNRQVQMVACAILEGNQQFGVDLPEGALERLYEGVPAEETSETKRKE